MISEFAPAKVNLTLHITGQREDGYHLLDSLVVFADIGDEIGIFEANTLSLTIQGPEAEGVPADMSNSILKAATFFNPQAAGAAFLLTKNLPSAAGIGGGSADAAAAIRGLIRHRDADAEALFPKGLDLANLSDAEANRLAAKVKTLGADLPVCLFSHPARMRGIGADLTFIRDLPQLHAVLVNPRVAVPTPEVFKAITTKTNPPMPDLPDFPDAASLIQWLTTQRNDMQSAAVSLFPEIGDVIGQLEAQESCQLARMSGSGATCFGLFPDAKAAQIAVAKISAEHPGWWVRNCLLGG